MITEKFIQAIYEAKKKKASGGSKSKPTAGDAMEFDISKLYGYLKAYIVAKFKVGEFKLRELKLNTDYFYSVIAVEKSNPDFDYISKELRSAIAKKFDIKENDVTVAVIEDSGKKENAVITIEYKKQEAL